MHLTIEQLIQAGAGLLTVGMAWGVMRGRFRGIEQRLEQHIETTSEWRTSLDARVQSITDKLMQWK